MSLLVETAGLLTLIEGAPRRGLRHLGVPASGAADPLSLALANRLAGNALDAGNLGIADNCDAEVDDAHVVVDRKHHVARFNRILGLPFSIKSRATAARPDRRGWA